MYPGAGCCDYLCRGCYKLCIVYSNTVGKRITATPAITSAATTSVDGGDRGQQQECTRAHEETAQPKRRTTVEKYRGRDAQEASFRWPGGLRPKRNRTQKKTDNYGHSQTKNDSSSHTSIMSNTMGKPPQPSTPITTVKFSSPTPTPLSTISAAWSPRILGHHQFGEPEDHETLAFTPQNMSKMMSYYEHLSEVRENFRLLPLYVQFFSSDFNLLFYFL